MYVYCIRLWLSVEWYIFVPFFLGGGRWVALFIYKSFNTLWLEHTRTIISFKAGNFSQIRFLNFVSFSISGLAWGLVGRRTAWNENKRRSPGFFPCRRVEAVYFSFCCFVYWCGSGSEHHGASMLLLREESPRILGRGSNSETYLTANRLKIYICTVRHVGVFVPALWTIAPLTFSLVHLPPPFTKSKYIIYRQCVAGKGWGGVVLICVGDHIVQMIKGTQDWEFFLLRFRILYYLIVSSA